MTHTKTDYYITLEKAYLELKDQIDTYGDPTKVTINLAETIMAFIEVAKLLELDRYWYD